MAAHQSLFQEEFESETSPDARGAQFEINSDYNVPDNDLKGLLSPQSSYTPSEATAYDPYSTQPSTPYTPLYTPPWKETPTIPATESDAKTYRKNHGTFSSVSILLLSIYSTIFSGIWLGLAIAKPHYRFVNMSGGMSPSAASTLVAAFAKSIELAFVTIYVAFIGQFLSRTALDVTGITIADMVCIISRLSASLYRACGCSFDPRLPSPPNQKRC